MSTAPPDSAHSPVPPQSPTNAAQRFSVRLSVTVPPLWRMRPVAKPTPSAHAVLAPSPTIAPPVISTSPRKSPPANVPSAFFCLQKAPSPTTRPSGHGFPARPVASRSVPPDIRMVPRGVSAKDASAVYRPAIASPYQPPRTVPASMSSTPSPAPMPTISWLGRQCTASLARRRTCTCPADAPRCMKLAGD